ncbi:hypothetical protein [Bacteriovorax sp. DB6_IX]|uniref:hypothetical protein n=1 Tax=Bacteriovorax sp. DB6_IX TaxID=1353530 RepID=UPI00038A025C|nr:hypothetical protein [Bacteriovorax sp. DB6_IX]EQC52326.1 hypothetical protein M901_2522 [Bacteriovorax sp. DB6_IX]
MKVIVILIGMLVSSNIFAKTNCDIHLVMSEVDGNHRLTNKILNKFEKKGYKITKAASIADIEIQDNVSYMTIFSDVHWSFGARTSVKIVNLTYTDGSLIDRSESEFNISRNPLVGSAQKSLLRKVSRKIPSCKK